MITYKLRPDSVPVRIDSETKTITNVVNKPDQKIIGYMTNEQYFAKLSEDSVNWPSTTEEEFNEAKAAVQAVVSAI